MAPPPPHAEFRPGDQAAANKEWQERCEDYEKVERFNRLSASYARRQERQEEAAAAGLDHELEKACQPAQLNTDAYESDGDAETVEEVFQEDFQKEAGQMTMIKKKNT